MPYMVIILGNGVRRSPPLSQDELNKQPGAGSFSGGCPTCTEGGLAAFEAGSSGKAVLLAPSTEEMYVITFDGATQEAAKLNLTNWMKAEDGWLNKKNMVIHTFYY